MNAEQAWQSVLAQLQLDMSRASFERWLRDTQATSLDDEGLLVSVPDGETRDWLEARLTSTVQRLLIGVLDKPAAIRFVAAKHEPQEEDQEVAIESVQWLDYESIVRPERRVVVKGYLRRLGSEIGAKAIWLYIGFHQAAWMAHDAQTPAGSILHSREVRRFSGLSFGAFWRALRQPAIQKHLHGLVERIDAPDTPRYRRGRDGRPHRIPVRYRVYMTPRLTHADASALYMRLKGLLEQALTLEAALRQCLSAENAIDLLQASNNMNTGIQFDTAMQIAQALSAGTLSPEENRLAQELHRKIINALGDIHVTHYFITRVIREFGLTPAQAWLVTVARDMAYLNWRTGERREVITFREGYREMAALVGSRRPKTAQAWFNPSWASHRRGGDLCNFMQEIDLPAANDYTDLHAQTMPRTFHVLLDEPLDANGTNRLDADGTNSVDAHGTNRLGADGSNMADANGTVKNSIKHSRSTHGESTSNTAKVRAAEALVPACWELARLLQQNRVHPKVQRELLEAQIPASVFVSWVLFAAGREGKWIADPLGHAVSRLRAQPRTGAGAVFEQLAALPPSKLKSWVERALEDPFGIGPRAEDREQQAWREALGSNVRSLTKVHEILFGKGGLE